ncbi:hypothetical protein BV25DRAFT_982284 [Artomyces pyxidatus]|uniref:Uncharacterized protein n=1 Tax=Artomyces pyxidatus TaxID=48021 RepID=A0ACB8SVG4_9AGAM|nr:hypothetical protein BV25DRAFT_982284 [Artomyces pyxidatus]
MMRLSPWPIFGVRVGKGNSPCTERGTRGASDSSVRTVEWEAKLQLCFRGTTAYRATANARRTSCHWSGRRRDAENMPTVAARLPAPKPTIHEVICKRASTFCEELGELVGVGRYIHAELHPCSAYGESLPMCAARLVTIRCMMMLRTRPPGRDAWLA